MKMLLAVAFALLMPMAAMASPSSQAADNAKAWLALVDAGNYDASWSAASSFFQSKVTREQWVSMIKPVRDGIGALVSRGPAQVTLTDEMPNAPTGHYAVVTFHSKFATKGDANEMAIMILQDGDWKLAGYFVK